MKLLVDECCDPRLVATLRRAGHDVRYVLESDAGASDEQLAALSIEQHRILITEDKDFGELAMRHGKTLPGFDPAPDRTGKPATEARARAGAARQRRKAAAGQVCGRRRDQYEAPAHSAGSLEQHPIR